jgi:hypothetical protein
MQRKDFNFIRNNFSSTKDFYHIFKNKKIIANVVEQDGNVVGWVAYRLFENNIKIVKFAFKNEQIFDFILSKLVLKSISNIDINISEYDLKMHLLLKNSEFKAISSIKVNDVYFYKFSKQIKIMA